MADKRVVVYDTTLNVPDELTATDRASFPGGFVNAGAPGEMGTQKLTGLSPGTLGTDGVNLAQLEQAVISGGSVKEALLHEDQIDNAEGFLGSIAVVFANQPVSGDTIIVHDSVTTRIYSAVAGGDVQYALGGSTAITMQNFVDAVNGDGSATVIASLTTDLLGIAPVVVVLTEKDNDLGAGHELYGVWTTPADIDVVDFTAELDYTKKALTDMPAAAPPASNFGVRRTQAALTDGEMHFVINNDVIYSWDDSANVWNVMSGSASIPDATGGSGGATKGKLTIDTDNGLSISTGILSANIDAVTIDFNGGAMEVTGLPANYEINGTAVGNDVTAVNMDTLTDGSNADALHVHAGSVAIEAPKVENTYVAQADCAAGDPVHFAANDEVAPSDAATLTGIGAQVMGVARTTDTATNPIEVVTVGPCAGVLAGAAFGDDYFLENGGGLTNATPTGSGKRRLWKLGYALNATDLFVELQDLGIRTIP
jgi:hypothetical protein